MSDPAHPVRVGGHDTPGWANGVAVSGHYAYVADEGTGLQVIDVSDPAHPVRVGGYDTPGYARGVAVSGHYAYVADGWVGLQVIDVSDPAHPVRVGGYDTPGYAWSVAVSGHYAYVADGDAGLQVIDVSDPAHPVRVGGYDTPGYARGVAVSGHYAYVADGSRGLQVIDVSDPAHPVRGGGDDTPGYARGVAVSGHYAYVADGSRGLQVIDVSDPAHPVRVGGYDTPANAYGVAVSGHYAYVADDYAGLQVIDVSDPAHPVRVGGYDTPGNAWSVAVSGHYAYVADERWNLQILRIEGSSAPQPVLAGLRGQQRPGTTLVEVDYELGPGEVGSAQVSVAFSRDGGANFDIHPQAAALSGDVGAGVAPGKRRLVWNAGRTLPVGTFGANFVARVTAIGSRGSVSAESERFTLDLGGLRSIRGRVVDAVSRQPVAGATVSYAGATRTTDPAGQFVFESGSWPNGQELVVSKAGALPSKVTISAPPGVFDFIAPTIALAPAGQAKPVVVAVQPEFTGIFLEGVPTPNRHTVRVNWNGRPEGRVQFWANDTLLAEVPAAGSEATAEVDMGAFPGRFLGGENRLRVVAVAGDGTPSEPRTDLVSVIPVPEFLRSGLKELRRWDWSVLPGVSWEFSFPGSFTKAQEVIHLPFLGSFGPKFELDISFGYEFGTGQWELFAGKQFAEGRKAVRGRRPQSTLLQPRFYFGNAEWNFVGGAKAEGIANLSRGISVERLGVAGGFKGRLEILSFYVTDWVPGAQIIRLLDSLRHVGVVVNSIQRIRVDGLLDLEANVMLLLPSLAFDEATLKITPGVEAVYEPNLHVVHGRIAVGGEVEALFELAPQFGFQEASAQLYLSLFLIRRSRNRSRSSGCCCGGGFTRGQVGPWLAGAGPSPQRHRRLAGWCCGCCRSGRPGYDGIIWRPGRNRSCWPAKTMQ
ncbi:MAG: hypothetical protein IPM17_02060 [Verrucomicrobia bacterium]|nr:hypothetical protein [Verrucomicrobiota bacterium]